MNEKILKKGGANWWNGIVSKGGHLILTNETLYFEAHKVNSGKKEFEIELENIKFVKAGCFLTNNITVITNSRKEVFVVYGKKNWVTVINDAIKNLEG